MTVKKVSDYNKKLDFQPLEKWNSMLPALAANETLLSGFSLDKNHPVFDWGTLEPDLLLQKFSEIYAQLTLPELARLIHLDSGFSFQQLAQAFHFHPTEDLLSVLKILSAQSLDVQNWLSQKKWGLSELRPLLLLNLNQQTQILHGLFQKNGSKQDSVTILELLCDLLLMKYDFAILEEKSLPQLKLLRFPMTADRDEQLKQSPLPWPSMIKSKVQRRGDRAGFDVQFFAGSPVELEKLSDQLKKVAQQWSTHLDPH